MLQDPSFWVAMAFVVFILLIAKKALDLSTTALDTRADRIRSDLDQSEKLLAQAQEILADYQKRQREAAKEVENIRTDAENQAATMFASGKKLVEENLKMREKLALERISFAETQAASEVKESAIEIAIAASRIILESQASTDSLANELINQSVQSLPSTLK